MFRNAVMIKKNLSKCNSIMVELPIYGPLIYLVFPQCIKMMLSCRCTHPVSLKIHWRLSTILKTSKKLYQIMFFGMLKYVYSENAFNTPYIKIKHVC